MNSLGRLAVVCGLFALVGCGPEAPVTETSGEATKEQAASPIPSHICPDVMYPLCENGELYPIYSGKCLVGFQCVPDVTANAICPNPVYPGPGFCEDGIITPVYVGGCIVRYTCTR
ncbi:hypothetical protein [Myxococcus eversor]|uniref:hypothetical protein n=1 Tax=Myxococcus eversor TaxID=2709661 RepID=UPI0013D4C8A0|nr:hypothetical protein [Myxococcus eversor]